MEGHCIHRKMELHCKQEVRVCGFDRINTMNITRPPIYFGGVFNLSEVRSGEIVIMNKLNWK